MTRPLARPEPPLDHAARDSKPEVAVLREVPGGVDPHLVSLLSPHSFEADQYRGLRHFLEQARATRGLKVVGITSPVAGDGKTITATNLALTLAQSGGTRVLLVDADLRRPNVAADLGLGVSDRGLGTVAMDEQAELAGLVRKTPHGLDLLAAGFRPRTRTPSWSRRAWRA